MTELRDPSVDWHVDENSVFCDFEIKLMNRSNISTVLKRLRQDAFKLAAFEDAGVVLCFDHHAHHRREKICLDDVRQIHQKAVDMFEGPGSKIIIYYILRKGDVVLWPHEHQFAVDFS